MGGVRGELRGWQQWREGLLKHLGIDATGKGGKRSERVEGRDVTGWRILLERLWVREAHTGAKKRVKMNRKERGQQFQK